MLNLSDLTEEAGDSPSKLSSFDGTRDASILISTELNLSDRTENAWGNSFVELTFLDETGIGAARRFPTVERSFSNRSGVVDA